MDFSIVIPHRGNSLGLWATIHSCIDDLKGTPLTYNFVVVSNGEEPAKDIKDSLSLLKKSNLLLEHIHSEEGLTPPVARQRGAQVADGKLLVFFDNHCLVSKKFFERVALDFEKYNMDSLRSTVLFSYGDPIAYHYKLRLEYNFWATYSHLPADQIRPYPIAACGHGAFITRKTVWDEVGGYGPEELFKGYGGEEMIFDLKLWRYGKSVHIDPRLLHYHYAGPRGYARHYTDEYYTNLLVSALVIGGEKWLYKVFDSFINKKHIRLRPQKSWYEILETAYHRGAEYSRHVDSKSIRPLDDTLKWFREHQVAL